MSDTTSPKTTSNVGRRGSSFKGFSPGMPKHLGRTSKSTSSKKDSSESRVEKTGPSEVEGGRGFTNPLFMGLLVFAVVIFPLVQMVQALTGKGGSFGRSR